MLWASVGQLSGFAKFLLRGCFFSLALESFCQALVGGSIVGGKAYRRAKLRDSSIEISGLKKRFS